MCQAKCSAGIDGANGRWYSVRMVVVYNQHAAVAATAAGDSDALPARAARAVWDARPTETQRVYDALKRAILAGQFRPGEPLQEVRIAAEFGASRTPVREAFHKLEADGLLTITPRRGAYVQQPTARDFLDMNELRLVLEPAAAAMAAGVVNGETVADLQRQLSAISAEHPSESDFAALEDLDRLLHLTIVEAIPNRRMAKIIQGLDEMMQIIRSQDMRRRHRELHVSIGDILAALATRDGALAETLMRRHIGDFSGALRTLM